MRSVLFLAVPLLLCGCAGGPDEPETSIPFEEYSPRRPCSRDSIETYAARYYFEFNGAAARYTERYAHCLA